MSELATNSGDNQTYTLQRSLQTGTEIVFVNGVAQDPQADYTLTGTILTFTNPLAPTDKVRCYYHLPDLP